MSGESPEATHHYTVFISHSGRDIWVAKQLARVFAEQGATVFLDAINIDAGSNFAEEIRSNLRRANELVVLWTPWALDRPFILAEVGGAWTRGIPIIQLLYGISAAELTARPGFPIFLKALDMIQLDDLDEYLPQLVQRMRSIDNGSGG
jgi:hypothetical protein